MCFTKNVNIFSGLWRVERCCGDEPERFVFMYDLMGRIVELVVGAGKPVAAPDIANRLGCGVGDVYKAALLSHDFGAIACYVDYIDKHFVVMFVPATKGVK